MRKLISNVLAFKISEIIELNFTPRSDFIDVIVNGNFRGNYFICEQIEVNDGRIDFEKISDDDISVGNLIEINIRVLEEEKIF